MWSSSKFEICQEQNALEQLFLTLTYNYVKTHLFLPQSVFFLGLWAVSLIQELFFSIFTS